METNKYVEVKDTLVTKFKFECTQMFLRFVKQIQILQQQEIHLFFVIPIL